ncbi:PAAR domain-containing protein [Dryocola clanedunensis]|uniref:PAAR domain-containing protein n=1 Tax=Cedecea sulfonylureivorans TaxID=3051154 RepID=UPI001925EA09|nr:PAAR domain-containing protein [Cedecea sulfonylureivorans]
MKQYTNELTAEMLAAFDPSPFTAEQLAEMNEEVRSLITQRNAYNLAYPVTAAYLIATEGSLTRDGGTVISEYNGQQIEIEGSVRLNVSLVGDGVRYPDGTTAKISTGAGNSSGDSAALVGSLLDNGDEIISSPQGSVRKAARAGEPLPESFLK